MAFLIGHFRLFVFSETSFDHKWMGISSIAYLNTTFFKETEIRPKKNEEKHEHVHFVTLICLLLLLVFRYSFHSFYCQFLCLS